MKQSRKKKIREMKTASETSVIMLNSPHLNHRFPEEIRQKERAWENIWGENS